MMNSDEHANINYGTVVRSFRKSNLKSRRRILILKVMCLCTGLGLAVLMGIGAAELSMIVQYGHDPVSEAEAMAPVESNVDLATKVETTDIESNE